MTETVFKFKTLIPSDSILEVVYDSDMVIKIQLLTSLFYKNTYWKVIYVYSYECNFQDKSIYMILTISNSST
jgi:hypothetical protein